MWKIRLPPEKASQSGPVMIGFLAATPNFKHIIEIEDLQSMDSVRLTNPDLGTLKVLNSNTILFETNATQGSGHINVYCGLQVLVISVKRR